MSKQKLLLHIRQELVRARIQIPMRILQSICYFHHRLLSSMDLHELMAVMFPCTKRGQKKNYWDHIQNTKTNTIYHHCLLDMHLRRHITCFRHISYFQLLTLLKFFVRTFRNCLKCYILCLKYIVFLLAAKLLDVCKVALCTILDHPSHLLCKLFPHIPRFSFGAT